jgi:hypothetical protein
MEVVVLGVVKPNGVLGLVADGTRPIGDLDWLVYDLCTNVWGIPFAPESGEERGKAKKRPAHAAYFARAGVVEQPE